MIVLFSVLGTALGGALGALSRWKLDLAVKTRWIEKRALAGKPLHPYVGIVVVNTVGCFLLGFLTGILPLLAVLVAGASKVDYPGITGTVRFVLSTGFLGGFTTFSTAVLDAWTEVWAHRVRAGMSLIGVGWVSGLVAYLLGLGLTPLVSYLLGIG